METKCLVIDDEPPARDLLVSYIKNIEGLTLVGQFGNAIEAFNYLQTNNVGLMFLDIQMPGMSGMELIKSLQYPPRIVLTTAYREYASDGYDLDVLDYLVKPISFSRFMKAIAKYHHYHLNHNDAEQLKKNFNEAYFFIKVNKEQVKIFYKDILYIESIKDYLKIITLTKTYITYDRLMYMEEKLPEDKFLRIHKSYIIAIDKVTIIRHDSVIINDKELPIGRVYKQNFTDNFPKQDRNIF